MSPILFPRNTGLAQPGKICGFDQGADLRHSPRLDRPQTGGAGVKILTYQAARFGELPRSGIGTFRPPPETAGLAEIRGYADSSRTFVKYTRRLVHIRRLRQKSRRRLPN